MQGLRSNSALLWAPEKVGVRSPILILSPLLGDPGECRRYIVIQLICWPPRGGSSEVANSDFLPFPGDPRECRRYVVIQPICGPRRRQG